LERGSRRGIVLTGNKKKALYVLIGLFLLTLPLYGSYYFVHIVNFAGINLIVVLGLGLLVGFSGQVSIGHAAFYGIGAYASALLTLKVGFSFWIALPAAAVIAAIAGVLLAIPSLKVSALYLVMTTIGFSMIVWLVMLQWSGLTNGPNGIIDIPPPSIGGFKLDSPMRYYYLILPFALAAVWLMRRIVRSDIGLRLMAIFDQEEAAKAVGVNTTYFRVLAFVISAAFAGVGGSLYGHYVSFIHPDNFNIWVSVIFLVMAVFGGQRSIGGITAAVVTLTFATEYFRVLGDYRMIGYGVLLAVGMIYFPDGIATIRLTSIKGLIPPRFRTGG
jgi:branched-chain amino acid transport system permease protein